jgi:hypothetical protein
MTDVPSWGDRDRFSYNLDRDTHESRWKGQQVSIRGITNVSGVAKLHVQPFGHIFHDHPMPGMRRFEITPCTPHDRATSRALERSVLSIDVCMLEFVGKCGRKTVEDGDDEGDE